MSAPRPTSLLPGSEPPGLRRFDLLALAALAALPRLAGLGHVSLWLDEILGTMQTSGSLGQAWSTLRLDRVHPPLWGLLDWLGQRVTDSEPLRRLLPIALGVGTLLLLADFVARQAGRRTGIATALIAAFSPLHLRFSQELRPYSLGLFFLVLALWLALRAGRSGRRRDFAGLAFALWGCFASLYLAALAPLPALILLVGSERPLAATRAALLRFAAALAAALLAFVPWLAVVGGALAMEHQLRATPWTLDLVARRWHYLTVGGADGEAATAAAALTALLALAGALAAARRPLGRAALAALLAATVGVELLLVAADHWTNGRYSIAAWPFLVVLMALGCTSLGGLAARLLPATVPGRHAALTAAAVAAILLAELPGLARYYESGRPDWTSVAANVRAIVGAAGPVWVANDWTRVSLGYYLGRLEGEAVGELPPRVQVATLPLTAVAPGRCGALVVAGYPERPDLAAPFLTSPAQIGFPRSAARLLALPPAAAPGTPRDPWACLPAALSATPAERVPGGLAARLARPPRLAAELDLGAGAARQLAYGWSYAERDRRQRAFRWAVGEWAAVKLPGDAGSRLLLRGWSFGPRRGVTLYRDRVELTRITLGPAPSEVEIPWSAPTGAAPAALLELRFDGWAAPGENARPLAAAFGRVAVLP